MLVCSGIVGNLPGGADAGSASGDCCLPCSFCLPFGFLGIVAAPELALLREVGDKTTQAPGLSVTENWRLKTEQTVQEEQARAFGVQRFLCTVWLQILRVGKLS